MRCAALALALVALASPALPQATGTDPWLPTSTGKQYGLAITTNIVLTIPALTKCAAIGVETANVRYSTDGSNPTTTVGQLVTPGTPLQFCGPVLGALKFTAVSGSPTLNVDYFK